MKTFTFKVDNEDRDTLSELYQSLHPEETLRLRFDGVLSLTTSLCQVSISIVEGLKIFRENKRSSGYHGKEYVLNKTLDKLPYFKKQVNESGHLIVYFEAPILSIEGNKIEVSLPESYKTNKESEPENGEYKIKTFTFKTEHTYLLGLISMIVNEKPVAYFYGPLNANNPSQSKVEVSLPVRLEAKTKDDGRVCLPTQDLPIAVLNELPEWEERAERLGCPGFMFVNFEAVIIKACDGEITVELPNHYR